MNIKQHIYETGSTRGRRKLAPGVALRFSVRKILSSLFCSLLLLCTMGCVEDRIPSSETPDEANATVTYFEVSTRASHDNPTDPAADRREWVISTVNMIVFRHLPNGSKIRVPVGIDKSGSLDWQNSEQKALRRLCKPIALKSGTYDFYFITSRNGSGGPQAPAFRTALEKVSKPEDMEALNYVFDAWNAPGYEGAMVCSAHFRGVKITDKGGTITNPTPFSEYITSDIDGYDDYMKAPSENSQRDVLVKRAVSKVEVIFNPEQATSISSIRLLNAAKHVYPIEIKDRNLALSTDRYLKDPFTTGVNTENWMLKNKGDAPRSDGKYIVYIPEKLLNNAPEAWPGKGMVKKGDAAVNALDKRFTFLHIKTTSGDEYTIPLISNIPTDVKTSYMEYVTQKSNKPDFSIKRNIYAQYKLTLKSGGDTEVQAVVTDFEGKSLDASIYQYELVTPQRVSLYVRTVRPKDREKSTREVNINITYPGEVNLEAEGELATQIDILDPTEIKDTAGKRTGYKWKIKPKFEFGEFGERAGNLYGRITGGKLKLTVQNLTKHIPVDIIPWVEIEKNKKGEYTVLTIHPESGHELLYKTDGSMIKLFDKANPTPTVLYRKEINPETLNQPGMATSFELYGYYGAQQAEGSYMTQFLFEGSLNASGTAQGTPPTTIPDWYWCSGYERFTSQYTGTGCSDLSGQGHGWRMPSDREVALIMEAARVVGYYIGTNNYREFKLIAETTDKRPFLSREHQGDWKQDAIRLYTQQWRNPEGENGKRGSIEGNLILEKQDFFGVTKGYNEAHNSGFLKVRPVRDFVR